MGGGMPGGGNMGGMGPGPGMAPPMPGQMPPNMHPQMVRRCKLNPNLKAPGFTKVQPNEENLAFNLNLFF